MPDGDFLMKMKKHITNEKKVIRHTLCGDYCLPDLAPTPRTVLLAYTIMLSFKIKLAAIKEFKKGMATHYPYVLSGAGAVIPEDLSVPELMEWSESEYKEYDCESDNALLKGKMQILKN